MYAIIESGGKQYRVTTGDVLSVEKLEGPVGQKLTFNELLLVSGTTTLVGTPFVEKAAVEAEIVEHTKGEKIRTIKYKRRKGYRRTMGHRQILTRLLITRLEDGQGNKLECDSNKRKEALIKASVKFSVRAEKRAEAHEAKSGKTAAPKTAGKSASASEKPKAAPKAAKTATAAKAKTAK